MSWKGGKNVISWFLLLHMCLSFGQGEPTKKKVLVIDPGHGGKDSGARGMHGVFEKDVVLYIAHEIHRLNHLILNNKFEIYLTRYTDTLISLSDRASLARALKSDLFISLHCNSARTGASGMEVFVPEMHNPHIASSEELAVSILYESSNKLGIRGRGVKRANFQVQRETMDQCPTILIETGFITHADEALYFKDQRNIKAVALTILLGIYKYLHGAGRN